MSCNIKIKIDFLFQNVKIFCKIKNWKFWNFLKKDAFNLRKWYKKELLGKK